MILFDHCGCGNFYPLSDMIYCKYCNNYMCKNCSENAICEDNPEYVNILKQWISKLDSIKDAEIIEDYEILIEIYNDKKNEI